MKSDGAMPNSQTNLTTYLRRPSPVKEQGFANAQATHHKKKEGNSSADVFGLPKI